jgi:hypothetical protein
MCEKHHCPMILRIYDRPGSPQGNALVCPECVEERARQAMTTHPQVTDRMSIAGRLFQARMWRLYAMIWDLPVVSLERQWVPLQYSRAECLRRAHINIYLAKRAGRKSNV